MDGRDTERERGHKFIRLLHVEAVHAAPVGVGVDEAGHDNAAQGIDARRDVVGLSDKCAAADLVDQASSQDDAAIKDGRTVHREHGAIEDVRNLIVAGRAAVHGHTEVENVLLGPDAGQTIAAGIVRGALIHG